MSDNQHYVKRECVPMALWDVPYKPQHIGIN